MIVNLSFVNLCLVVLFYENVISIYNNNIICLIVLKMDFNFKLLTFISLVSG